MKKQVETRWEKEKLLFQCVFKRLVLQTHKNQGLFGKGLNDKMFDTINLKAFMDYR